MTEMCSLTRQGYASAVLRSRVTATSRQTRSHNDSTRKRYAFPASPVNARLLRAYSTSCLVRLILFFLVMVLTSCTFYSKDTFRAESQNHTSPDKLKEVLQNYLRTTKFAEQKVTPDLALYCDRREETNLIHLGGVACIRLNLVANNNLYMTYLFISDRPIKSEEYRFALLNAKISAAVRKQSNISIDFVGEDSCPGCPD